MQLKPKRRKAARPTARTSAISIVAQYRSTVSISVLEEIGATKVRASALGRIQSFVKVCDFSVLETCYAELNDRLRPKAAIQAVDQPESTLMKTFFLLKVLASVFMCCLATFANAQEPRAFWQLRVMDILGQPRVDATIRFSDDTARSCIGSGWKRVYIEKIAVRADDFFPLTTSLAYKIDGGVLTLGRTEVCDGYLFLTGKTGSLVTLGTYDSVGWGRKTLGSFSLQKILEQ